MSCGQTYFTGASHTCLMNQQMNQQYFSGAISGTAFTLPGALEMDGTKITVICSGTWEQFDTIEKAQAKAEELAHAKSADAFILKPVKKVSPKRDVVTTDL